MTGRRPSSARSRCVAFFLVAGVAIAVWSQYALAHQRYPERDAEGNITRVGAYIFGLYPDSYTDPTYGPIDGRDAPFYFDKSFPGPTDGRKRDAVVRSANAWTRLGRDFRYAPVRSPEISVGGWEGYCSTDSDGDGNRDVVMREGRPVNVVYWGQPASLGDSFGATKICLHRFTDGQPYMPWAFDIVFNSGYRWYSGRGKDVPPRRYDLQSTATHEFGHATGWLPHFNRAGGSYDPLPGNKVCGINNPDRFTMCGGGVIANSVRRTPEKHDRHTFGAYPDDPDR
jgi:hypothetical protein